jgi:hypothetical protein
MMHSTQKMLCALTELYEVCDLAEWLERCASIPKTTGLNPSGGGELTFRSHLLLTARGGST